MKNTTKPYKDMPADYPLCLHADCPMADTCLHQLAFRRHDELDTYLNLINPARCTKQADCPYHVDSRPVRFAKGFMGMQKRMYPEQYGHFMTLLICHFGRNSYFKRRRGDILLPPKEQEVIRIALEKAGVSQPMEFDQYVEAIHWLP
ncbi:MAG: DUF6078 family protein [Bacteroidaceae bacterium]